ncbi:MAG: energy transducer TonB [Trichormus sp. ATA11-4-KO1]|jgi:TonB family protein|nr:energy transducer TonB [Trichormus sp. ATA11-4-KO1]
MSFSSIPGVFFADNAIASIALQISVLLSGISNFLLPLPSEEYQPIKAIEQPEQVQESLHVQIPETRNEELTQCLSRVRDLRASRNSSVSSSKVPSNNPSRRHRPIVRGSKVPSNNPSGSGIGIGTNVSNEQRIRRRPAVVIEPTPRKINNSSNSRASCTQCSVQYPESAKRQAIEGRVEIVVDTDEKGNVTNVRLVRSSGNPILDEETLRQARSWKLKPSSTGRQGVSIATEYALQGSCRSLELQERRRYRQ